MCQHVNIRHDLLGVTTCLENLEMFGNFTADKESQGIDQKLGKCQDKIFSEKTLLLWATSVFGNVVVVVVVVVVVLMVHSALQCIYHCY